MLGGHFLQRGFRFMFQYLMEGSFVVVVGEVGQGLLRRHAIKHQPHPAYFRHLMQEFQIVIPIFLPQGVLITFKELTNPTFDADLHMPAKSTILLFDFDQHLHKSIIKLFLFSSLFCFHLFPHYYIYFFIIIFIT